MNEILLHSLYIMFVIVCSVGLLCCREGPPGRRFWRFTPSVLFLASFVLYTSAMPVSRILHLSAPEAIDTEFMAVHLLAAVGLVCAYSLHRSFKPLPPVLPLMPASRKSTIMAVLVLIAMGLFLWRTLHFVGYSVVNLFERYRFEQDAFASDASTWDKIVVHFVSSAAAFALLLFGRRVKSDWQKRVTLAALVVVAVLLLIRGSRNPFLLAFLPSIGILYRHRAFPLGRALLVVLFAYASFQTIAIVRNVGLLNRMDAEIQVSFYDPIRSELGTSYNVWSAAKTTPFFDERHWGKTFFWTSIANMVPSPIWPGRPVTIATDLSFYYFERGGSETEVFGLGFSPVLEALLNFGIMGIAPWFFALGLGLRKIESWLEELGGWAICAWAALLPIAINVQRIDAAIAVKLYLIFIAFFVAFHFMFGDISTATGRQVTRRRRWRGHLLQEKEPAVSANRVAAIQDDTKI